MGYNVNIAFMGGLGEMCYHCFHIRLWVSPFSSGHCALSKIYKGTCKISRGEEGVDM